jgi:hypothetical protein
MSLTLDDVRDVQNVRFNLFRDIELRYKGAGSGVAVREADIADVPDARTLPPPAPVLQVTQSLCFSDIVLSGL